MTACFEGEKAMSSAAGDTVLANVGVRKCSFCAEEILSDARKCKHCGEFISPALSKSVGLIFASGVVVACIMAGTSEGATVVGVWAVFTLLFARMFGRG